MAKSVDEQIADLEAQIVKLQAEKHKLAHPFVEYPKYIADPQNSAKGRTVANAEEEKAVLASYPKADKPAKK